MAKKYKWCLWQLGDRTWARISSSASGIFSENFEGKKLRRMRKIKTNFRTRPWMRNFFLLISHFSMSSCVGLKDHTRSHLHSNTCARTHQHPHKHTHTHKHTFIFTFALTHAQTPRTHIHLHTHSPSHTIIILYHSDLTTEKEEEKTYTYFTCSDPFLALSRFLHFKLMSWITFR